MKKYVLTINEVETALEQAEILIAAEVAADGYAKHLHYLVGTTQYKVTYKGEVILKTIQRIEAVEKYNEY